MKKPSKFTVFTLVGLSVAGAVKLIQIYNEEKEKREEQKWKDFWNTIDKEVERAKDEAVDKVIENELEENDLTPYPKSFKEIQEEYERGQKQIQKIINRMEEINNER